MPPTMAAWSFLHARKHLILAFAISLALHVTAYWLSPQFVSAWRDRSSAGFDAVLLPTNVAFATLAPMPTVKPATAKPAPIRRVPRAHVAPPPMFAPESTTTESAPVAESAIAPTDLSPDATHIADAIAAPPVEPVAKTEEKVTPPIAETAPPEMPSRIAIAYRATSSVADGVADYTWKRTGNKYEVDSSLQASGFFVSLVAGVLHQVSRGEITAIGLQPDNFMMRRGDGEGETAEFLRGSNELRLTRGGKTRTLPLPAKIQDTQSFLFQLAFDAPRLKSPEDRLEVLVTNARKVYRHQFRQLGEAIIQTRMGSVSTLHLRSDAADPEDAYEVWLAPEYHYLPVKLKFYAGRFPIELIAASIRSTP